MALSTRLGRGAVLGVTAVATTIALGATASAAPAATGPSTTTAPYLVGTQDGVSFTSILTAGDVIGDGLPFAGTPDGIGAFDNGDGTFTMLVNHEFQAGAGVVRAHGATGSFVSKLIVDKQTLEVTSVEDLDRELVLADPAGSLAMARLCSADLASSSAFFNAASGLGYDGNIFLNGEETGVTGRAFGHVVETGTGYELPALGTAAWENLAANPSTGDRTVVVGQSDGGTQNVYVYAGDKKNEGTEIEKAGLTDGVNASILVEGLAQEDSVASMAPFQQLEFTLAEPDSGTAFRRPEDGAWDTRNPNVYYFATTASFTERSRLWKATFDDAAQPQLGGTIEVVFEGPTSPTEGPKMMDNLTVTPAGTVLVQEDPGSAEYLAGGFEIDPATGEATRLFTFDPAQFTPGLPGFITTNEESSGIVAAPFLGEGKYLIDAQVHADAADPAVVELGQVLVLDLGAADPVPAPAFDLNALLSFLLGLLLLFFLLG